MGRDGRSAVGTLDESADRPSFAVLQRIRDRPAGVMRTVALRLANSILARRHHDFVARLDGGRIVVAGNTEDVIQRHLLVFGTWEPRLAELVRSRMRPGDVFLDFGANIGYFSLLAARAAGPEGQVIAFEPVPHILGMLRRNIALSGLDNVEVQAVVAADREGRTRMFLGEGRNLGTSSTERFAGSVDQGEIRRVVAADAVPLALWDRVRMIKVDVEGDEMRVLRGLVPLLERCPTGTTVVVEVSPPRLGARGETADALMRLLTGLGFSASEMTNDYSAGFYANPVLHPLVPIESPPTSIADVVFTKTSPPTM